MDHFTHEGVWWLPDTPDRRVPGTLTLDDDGLQLATRDQLRVAGKEELGAGQAYAVGAEEWQVDPIIHGETKEREPVTLLEAGGMPWKLPSGIQSTVTEVYEPRFSLTGVHTGANEFVETRVSFDALDAWADPPPILDSKTLQTDEAHIVTAEIPDATLTLFSRVVGTSGAERVDLRRYTAFRVSFREPLSAEQVLQGFVRPLSDLLTITLGRSVRMTDWYLLPADHRDRKVTGRAAFDVVQSKSGAAITLPSVLNFSAPTLLIASTATIALEGLFVNWFELWKRHQRVIVLLNSTSYAPFMFGEHRYSSLFQSAEALANKVVETHQLTATEHRARVKGIVDALTDAGLPAEEVARARRLLSRNDRPLWERIEDLTRRQGAVGEYILQAVPTFGAVAASARTAVSHPMPGELDAIGRHWCGEALRWIVRVQLLSELGIDRADLQKLAVSRLTFKHIVDELRDAVARAEQAVEG